MNDASWWSPPELESRESLEELQSRKLLRLVRQDLPRSPFYRHKLERAGVDPGAIRGVSDLPRLPFTTKEEIEADQRAAPPYGTNLNLPLERYVRLHQTSGTTGEPTAWLDTAESWAWVVRCWHAIFTAAGVTAGDRFFVPFSFGPFLGFWGAFEGALGTGHFCMAGGGMTTQGRILQILRHHITAVACTPTYALRLAEAAREAGLDLAGSRVRSVFVAGEPGGSVREVRQRIERGWGARCFDHWGMTEVGPLGFEPRDRPGGLHLLETDCIGEVVDPATGEPVTGDRPGELVVTTLERCGSPLLRYRTGDIVSAAAPGDRRRPLREVNLLSGEPFTRFEGGVLGRVDQMVLVRGNNVYPGAIDALLAGVDDVVEYQAVVLEGRSGNRLRLRIEPRDDPALDERRLAERIVALVRERLYLRPDVEVVAPGALPRFEFKARRFHRQAAERGDDDTGGAAPSP